MTKYFLIFILCFHCLISCSQSRYAIKKINAFYIVKMPGNIPVDENGNSLFKGPDTLITIYAEISGIGPEWKTAWRNDKTYTVHASLVSQTPYEAGTKESDGKKVMLTPAFGNKLWQLTLMVNKNEIKLPQKLKPGELLLSGKFMGKIIYKKIVSLVQLTTFPSV
jgi:hypothetical protein